MLIFISGGVRSGKSTLGEQFAGSLATGRKIYLATAKASDIEMQNRIEKHQLDRAKKGFATIEKSKDINQISFQKTDTVLLDCLGTLVANEMFYDYSLKYNEKTKSNLIDKIFSDIEKLNNKVSNLIIISNEIFSSGITYDSATEHYIDVLGHLHIKIAALADKAIECIYKNNHYYKDKEVK